MTGRVGWIRRVAAGALATTVAATVTGLTAHRVAYGTFVGDPERISWCGREYHAGAAESVARADITAPYAVQPVARVPPVVGRTLLAGVTPPATRGQLGTPCAMVVWLRTGDDEFRSYDLSGGP